MFKYVLAAVAAIFMTSAANAATFSIHQFKTCEHKQTAGQPKVACDYFIYMTGAVEQGDNERLQKALKDRRIRRNPIMFLNSPGGNGHEMKLMVETLKKNPVRTVVNKGASCMSACAVIWTYGSTKIKHVDGKIGYHIGSINSGSFFENLVRDWGLLYMQIFVQERALDDILYYSKMPVKDKLYVVQKVAEEGNGSYNFWVISDYEAEYKIGAVIIGR